MTTFDSFETITLAGGCFWCTDAVFRRLRGVMHVACGYSNGNPGVSPNYELVCTGRTGYAEVVQLRFDPKVIDLQQILDVFFATHDPTTLNRQGHDVGSQYRSGIHWHVPSQQAVAQDAIDRWNASGVFDAPIVTEVLPLANYFPAEDYHQNYFDNHPGQGYCVAVIHPKLAKLRSKYTALLQTDA